MTTPAIHVAIPSYNNAAGVSKLLAALARQPFASVTVLDDASTDDTREVVESFPNVRYVRADKNGGTVAAKNLILRQMPEDGYILFIDSDMEIVTPDIPQRLGAFIAAHPNIGAGVGKIVNAEGEAGRFNRGYDLNPLRMVLAGLFYWLYRWTRAVPHVGQDMRYLASFFTMDVHDPDVPEQIDWAAEAFFFVRTDLFLAHGGFDARYKRFHEGPDLCLDIRKAGYAVWYVPDIIVRNMDQHTGTTLHRAYHWWRSECIYFLKHPSRLFLYKYPRP